MANLPKPLLMIAVLAFVLAVITIFTGPLVAGVSAEGLSRACSNLALLAIGIVLAWKPVHGSE